MMWFRWGWVVSATIAIASFQAASGQAPVILVGTIELQNVDGRLDHLAADVTAQRLYVAALGNNTVEVLDLKSGTRVKSVTGFRAPQGVAVLPDANVIAVANGEGEGIEFIDAGDYHRINAIRLGDDSDNVRYDLSAKRLFVGFGTGAQAAISPGDGTLRGEAKLSGHPESFQLERLGRRAFVNVPDANQIAVVDRTTTEVIATWPVVGAKANFPMALDEANHQCLSDAAGPPGSSCTTPPRERRSVPSISSATPTISSTMRPADVCTSVVVKATSTCFRSWIQVASPESRTSRQRPERVRRFSSRSNRVCTSRFPIAAARNLESSSMKHADLSYFETW